MRALPRLLDDLDDYTRALASHEPDELSREDALAYWINLYNAGALILAGEAYATGERSVLRLPGAFTRPLVRVAGEHLSLDNIEHGKVRRFGDPRIHAALVCGSVSCPTLRFEPFLGSQVDDQLEDQMRNFLASGGATTDGDTLALSRVFLWYGADFVRPHRMPSLIPARRGRIAAAVVPWLHEDEQDWFRTTRPGVRFQDYDWGLACSVRSPA